MLNLLKSDMYRLVRGKTFWVILFAFMAIIMISAVALWFVTTPTYGQMLQEGTVTASSQDAFSSLTIVAGESIVSGGLLTLVVSLLLTLFIVSDFSTGFAKNILAGRQSRTVYFAEKLVLIMIVNAAFVIAGLALLQFAVSILGISFVRPDTPGELVCWAALTWLMTCGYSCACVCIAWLFKSVSVGVAAVILVGGGIIEGIVTMALLNFIPASAQITSWFPLGSLKLLVDGGSALLQPASSGDGLVAAAHICITGLCLCILFAGISLKVVSRKDVC